MAKVPRNSGFRKGLFVGVVVGVVATTLVGEIRLSQLGLRVFSTRGLIFDTTALEQGTNDVPKQDNATLANADTTLVITSNLIPSHPRIRMLNETIESFFRMVMPDQSPDTLPMVIALDGLKPGHTANDTQRFEQMQENIQAAFPKVLITQLNYSQGISHNVYHAIQHVKTTYMYLLQHDMPFLLPINHSAMVRAMEDYPDFLRIVRFNKNENQNFHPRVNRCWGQNGPVGSIHGIHFTKTRNWSDNNQFASVAYYRELFEKYIIGVHRDQPMEFTMLTKARLENCTKFGPYLYGAHGDGPFIGHLDGRLTAHYRRLRL